ncbi:MAG: DUF1801 domain-containing protein [Thermoplasmata archaeon]|nr:DUF1801 domain-containing protein [Thermoplasmata archaeon]
MPERNRSRAPGRARAGEDRGDSGRRKVERYLARVPAKFRAPLDRLRATIRAAAPEAQELISYGIPAFRQGRLLVFYAAFEDHMSFFVGSLRTQRKFATELRPFLAGKGTVHFTVERPLPLTLVRRIVKARLLENAARVR